MLGDYETDNGHSFGAHAALEYAGDTASNSTTSGGLYGSVYGGYDLRLDQHNTITPELGVSALWSHIPSMDVKYNDPALNQSYDSQNYAAVYGNASLRWTGGFDVGGVLVKPTLMGGVRQPFATGKIKLLCSV